MVYLLGVDTGGTYTDAVLFDEVADKVIASAKSLTTRPDLSGGVGEAIDAAIARAGIRPDVVAMVSLSTTLATNALVEGQGGRVALVCIGFADAELDRAGLRDALGGDPVLIVAGGHDHSGQEVNALDAEALRDGLKTLDDGVTAFAVASSFATRNPGHELVARDLIRDITGKPVTCSHELSSALGGPKRALTAVLNARLIGMIERLITACEAHLQQIGVNARLMVVRGDGALVSATLARQKPIETILSGPAASIAGAQWLTGQTDALVSDIGGTTTDVALLRNGRPKIDPAGARVGPYRTMVEAVSMRTTGLGGDSEVHLMDGIDGGLQLGPRRLMPISLAARHFPDLVHDVLDHSLVHDAPASDGGQFVIPMWPQIPLGLDRREAAIVERLSEGPLCMGHAVQSRMDSAAVTRLLQRGLVMLAGVTPSDAAHVLGRISEWDKDAAYKALTLFSRRRTGAGQPVARNPELLAQIIVDQLTTQTVDCLLQAAFTEDGRDWDDPAKLARHPVTLAGLDDHDDILRVQMGLGVPVIGLGASAASYYGAVGERLRTAMIVPENAQVANAIGAVVGQVEMHADGVVTASGEGRFVVHLEEGPMQFDDQNAALALLEGTLSAQATAKAKALGVEEVRLSTDQQISRAEVEGRSMFVEARIRVTAQGRPRIAMG